MIIKLQRGYKTIIDDEDWEKVKDFTWGFGFGGRYVGTNIGGRKNHKQILLHRFIMNTPEGMHTDHINGNKLDNRKSNLRVCTPSQNQHNSRKWKKKTSKYKGVCWFKRDSLWQAEVTLNRRAVYLGRFKKEIDAARAYNKKAKELFGEFAFLNDV